jgi:hypothetical protein
MFCARWTRKGVPAAVHGKVGVRGARAERHHRAPPSRRRHLVVYLQWYLPRTRTRVMYVPATPPPPPVPNHDRVLPDATYPVRRDQTADTAVNYDTANILHSYDFKTCVSNFVRSMTCWLRSCDSHQT